jgi:hypothetical protein
VTVESFHKLPICASRYSLDATSLPWAGLFQHLATVTQSASVLKASTCYHDTYQPVYIFFLETLALTKVSSWIASCGSLHDMPRAFPYSCPICGRLSLRQLFENVSITANVDHELRNVGGVAAFMCTANGHIFFVMTKDIETVEGQAATAT